MKFNSYNIKLLILLIIVISWLIHFYQFSQVKIHLIEIEKNVDELLQQQQQQQQTNNRITASQQQQQQQQQNKNGKTSSSNNTLLLSNLSTTATTLISIHESPPAAPPSSSSSFSSSKTTSIRKEYTVQGGEWGNYLVVDPTRVKRSITRRYYNESTTAAAQQQRSLVLDSYLPFRNLEEKIKVCNITSYLSSPTTMMIDSIIYNRIQINGPNQGFYQINRTKTKTNTNTNTTTNTTTTLLQNHLLRNNVKTTRNEERRGGDDNKKKDPKFLCVLYTYHQNNHMISTIGETWGWKCDGFIAASTRNILADEQQQGYGSIKLPHRGKESYGNMWQKTRSILQYIYKHYYLDQQEDQFDFFYICGDDVHLIVENLKSTLNSMGNTAYTQPLFMGQWIPLIKNQSIYKSSNIKMLPPEDGGSDYFVGGGPGYVLNRLSLRILVEELSNCHSNVKSSTEDMLISDCLKRKGIYGNNSVDLYGRQRFDECPRIQNHITNALETNKLPSFWINTLKYWSYHFTTTTTTTTDNTTTTTTITTSDNYHDDDDIKKYHQPNNRISKQLIAMHGFKTPYELKQHHARLYNSC